MTQNLVIRKTTPPTRCDICHCSDQFDPLDGKCLRCAEIVLPATITDNSSLIVLTDNSSWQDRLLQYLVYSIIATVASFAATALFGLVGAYPLIIFTGAAAIFSVTLLLVLVATLACYIIYWTVSQITGAIYERMRSSS